MLEVASFGNTLPEAYHDSLKKLWAWGDIVPCPDYNTSQRELSITMYVQNPLQEPMISRPLTGW